MPDLPFADAAIRRTLDAIEERLGDDLTPEASRRLAEILFKATMSYLVPLAAETMPAGPVQTGRVLADVARLVKHGFSVLTEEQLEVELALYRGDERVVGVRTGTLGTPPPGSMGVN